MLQLAAWVYVHMIILHVEKHFHSTPYNPPEHTREAPISSWTHNWNTLPALRVCWLHDHSCLGFSFDWTNASACVMRPHPLQPIRCTSGTSAPGDVERKLESWQVWLTCVFVPRKSDLQRFKDTCKPAFCRTESLFLQCRHTSRQLCCTHVCFRERWIPVSMKWLQLILYFGS